MAIDGDGDVKVAIAGQRSWYFNPECCVLVTAAAKQVGRVGGQGVVDADDDETESSKANKTRIADSYN